ncbi:MAG: phosphomannomutase/phosphoglucomutase [Gammaproteobacteria bacterium]|nr:phosphomannomutase/phosphoglucomutase [Gammaproteobacteria bacterium]
MIDSAIFRAYDIRGVVETALTAETVRRIGCAFGSEMQRQGLERACVGRDGRTTGPMLRDALVDGLLSTGVDVIDIGMVPTPTLYFATHHFETGTGIMITGSHNPPEYNGLKMMMAGGALYGDQIQTLYQRIVADDFAQGEGQLQITDVLAAYHSRIVSDIKLDRPLKVAVDCGNGVTGVVAESLLRDLGCEVTMLFDDVDGQFPNHHPDPSKPENLNDITKAVLDNGLDLGLAFDGDGDRVGVIDNQGQVIWPDRQMILLSEDVLSRNPGAPIIFDVKCSRLLAEAIENAGGQPVMWKTGHSLVKKHLADLKAPLAGEMSGHIFFKERWYGFDDALYVAARLLEIFSKRSESVAEIFAAIPNSINTPELNIHFAEGEHHAFMAEFSKLAWDGAEVSNIDGVRADFVDGFGLVRASNTTPSLVIRFEADTAAGLARIQDQFRAAMLNVAPDLELPF